MLKFPLILLPQAPWPRGGRFIPFLLPFTGPSLVSPQRGKLPCCCKPLLWTNRATQAAAGATWGLSGGVPCRAGWSLSSHYPGSLHLWDITCVSARPKRNLGNRKRMGCWFISALHSHRLTVKQHSERLETPLRNAQGQVLESMIAPWATYLSGSTDRVWWASSQLLEGTCPQPRIQSRPQKLFRFLPSEERQTLAEKEPEQNMHSLSCPLSHIFGSHFPRTSCFAQDPYYKATWVPGLWAHRLHWWGLWLSGQEGHCTE